MIAERHELRNAVTRSESCTRLLISKSGAEQPAEVLLLDSYRYLIRVARLGLPARLQQKIDPADIVQETLLEAFRDLPRFTGRREKDLIAWVRKILLNNLFNGVRRYRSTAKRSIAREVRLTDATVWPLHLDRAVAISPIESVANHEQQCRLQAAVAALRHDYQEVILLRHQKGYAWAEVGVAMNRSSEAARKLWRRAILLLRSELGVE